MTRVRVRAFTFRERSFSLGKKPHVVFAQLHKDAHHTGRVLGFQSARAHYLGVKFLRSHRIHHRNHKVVQMMNVAIRCDVAAHKKSPFSLDLRHPRESLGTRSENTTSRSLGKYTKTVSLGSP